MRSPAPAGGSDPAAGAPVGGSRDGSRGLSRAMSRVLSLRSTRSMAFSFSEPVRPDGPAGPGGIFNRVILRYNTPARRRVRGGDWWGGAYAGAHLPDLWGRGYGTLRRVSGVFGS